MDLDDSRGCILAALDCYGAPDAKDFLDQFEAAVLRAAERRKRYKVSDDKQSLVVNQD